MFGFFKLDNKKPELSLWVLLLMCIDEHGDKNLYLFTTAAQSEPEAYIKAINFIKINEPFLYEIAQRNSGFSVINKQVLTKNKLSSILKVEKEHDFVGEMYHDKNRLIKEIIGKRSKAMLDENRNKFSTFEIAYIEDKLR